MPNIRLSEVDDLISEEEGELSFDEMVKREKDKVKKNKKQAQPLTIEE